MQLDLFSPEVMTILTLLQVFRFLIFKKNFYKTEEQMIPSPFQNF